MRLKNYMSYIALDTYWSEYSIFIENNLVKLLQKWLWKIVKKTRVIRYKLWQENCLYNGKPAPCSILMFCEMHSTAWPSVAIFRRTLVKK